MPTKTSAGETASGDTALIDSTVAELVAPAALVAAGAPARPARKGARA